MKQESSYGKAHKRLQPLGYAGIYNFELALEGFLKIHVEPSGGQ